MVRPPFWCFLTPKWSSSRHAGPNSAFLRVNLLLGWPHQLPKGWDGQKPLGSMYSGTLSVSLQGLSLGYTPLWMLFTPKMRLNKPCRPKPCFPSCKLATGMAPSADEGWGWPETLGIYVWRNSFCQFAGFVTWLDPPFGAFYPKNKAQQATRAHTMLSFV